MIGASLSTTMNHELIQNSSREKEMERIAVPSTEKAFRARLEQQGLQNWKKVGRVAELEASRKGCKKEAKNQIIECRITFTHLISYEK